MKQQQVKQSIFHKSRYFVLSGWLGLVLIGRPAGQVSQEPEQNFAIKVQVEETRIDAVVLDRKGHQIKDLKAEDFELYQDGKRQEIKSCIYVNETRRSSDGKFRKASKDSPLVSAPLIPREKAQRTIAFVIDNASMSLENFSNARMAVQKFLESQMEPGDLVSIHRTSGGIGALQLFSTDRIRIKVNRPGSAIHYRDGFFGVIDPPNSVPDSGMNALQQAIFSP